jgi:hypothetical protein
MYKPNTCLFLAQKPVSRRFGLDRVFCIFLSSLDHMNQNFLGIIFYAVWMKYENTLSELQNHFNSKLVEIICRGF